MRATILSKNGVVYLRDHDIGHDVIALTPTEAQWVSYFLQRYTGSEIVVQLRLAAKHAESQAQQVNPEQKEFNPYV